MSGECIATLKSSSHSSSAAVKSVAWVMNQSTPNNIASNEKNMFALVGYNDGIVSGWMISNNGNIDDSMTGRTSTLAFECHAHTASIEDIAVNNNASQVKMLMMIGDSVKDFELLTTPPPSQFPFLPVCHCFLRLFH